MKILCVIPSRIGSTRLPRKPLLPIRGTPMVQMVYEKARQCHLLSQVIVATDSTEIATVITNCGGQVELTDAALPTGTDRVAAVAKKYAAEVVINLQGDEPFVTPMMLEQLIAPYLAGELPEMATLASPLELQAAHHNAAIVKVVTDINHNALYFSRAPIPFFRNQPAHNLPVYQHKGIYAFRYDFLLHYPTLPQTPLEITEALEQLRVLEHGYRIKVCLTAEQTFEINTPEDLAKAQIYCQ